MPDATRSLAVAYLELGRGTQAAAELERVAARDQEPVEVRRAALWQAAELYDKAASPTNAARLYANYVKQYPSPLDPAMDARQKLADMAKAQNDLKVRSQWLDEIIRADKSAGTARTDRSKYLAAKATIETADVPVAVFNSVKLTAPLNKSLKSKRDAMEKTLAVYGQALDYGVAEVTTQATYGMAELYRQLGADLMASERPKKSGCGRQGTVRRAARGTGVPVRGKVHRVARDQCPAHRRWHLRSMGPAQLRCAGEVEAGALRQDRDQ